MRPRGLSIALALIVFLMAAGLGAGSFPAARHATAADQLWVNDLTYGSKGGGFYWDPSSGQVWTSERGWHTFDPAGAQSLPLWVNALTYGSKGGGFYLDPLTNQVWTSERGWHAYSPGGSNPPPATPAPAATGITVSGATTYTDSIGTLWTVGLVHNNLAAAASFIQVTANHYSASGQLLSTHDSYGDVDVVPAGGDSPFSIITTSPQPGIVRTEVLVTGFHSPPSASTVAPVGLTATITNTFTDTIKYQHIVGTVTNSGSTTYRFVHPIVALLDASGNVLRVDGSYTKPDTLGPGQTGTFEVIANAPPTPVASRRTWVTGRQ